MLQLLDLFLDGLLAAATPPVSKTWLLTFLDGQVSSTLSSSVLPAVGPGMVVLDFSSCVSVGCFGLQRAIRVTYGESFNKKLNDRTKTRRYYVLGFLHVLARSMCLSVGTFKGN